MSNKPTYSGLQHKAATGGPAPAATAPASHHVAHAGGVPKK